MAIVIIPCLLDDVTCTHQQAGNHFISCWHLPNMSDIEIWLLYKITSDIPSFFYSDQTATFGNAKIKRVHVCCQWSGNGNLDPCSIRDSSKLHILSKQKGGFIWDKRPNELFCQRNISLAK